MACTAMSVVPAAEAAGKKCPRGQFDRGGQCTRFTTAAKEVTAITRSVIATEGAKGLILRVNIGSRTLVNRGFGISMAGVPATRKMNFRPGAMTIPFLTTIALQLQDEGKLDLDDKLARWIPNYPNADRVTLRMLASSTSGYPDYIQGNPPFQAAFLADVFRQWTDPELVRYAFTPAPICDPGTCFHYAHTNFVVLGQALEKITKQSMTTLMKKRFLQPLGMRDTRISKLPGIPQPVLHSYSSERGVYEDATYWSPSWGIGKGVLMTSTSRDMIKAIRAIGKRKLISKSAFREFLAPYSRGLPGGPKFDYGLGVLRGGGWFFGNPEVNGYFGILGHDLGGNTSIVVDNTNGPNVPEGKNISGIVFSKLTDYLTPDHPLTP